MLNAITIGLFVILRLARILVGRGWGKFLVYLFLTFTQVLLKIGIRFS